MGDVFVSPHDVMDISVSHSQALRGTVQVPADKSIAHRATLLAAIASGQTSITPWPAADDCQRTLEIIQQLGVSVSRAREEIRIVGRGLNGLQVPSTDLFCGESGTTLRLAAGLLAGQPFASRLCAGPGLTQRPMRRIVEPLMQMGARLQGTTHASSAEVYPPLSLQGTVPLKAIQYMLPVASAQVKSAVLLAALFAQGPTTVQERLSTRDHTERMIRHFGGTLSTTGLKVTLTPGPLRSPGRIVLPGDFSSAAFFLVAAACIPGSHLMLEGVSLNPTRTALLGVLARMGAAITSDLADPAAWEPSGRITVEARSLRATTVKPNEVPGLIDELPILMVASACAQGLTRLEGLGELRVKETDRIHSMVSGLRQLGVRVQESAGDALDIEGGTLRGGVVQSAGDHRTAMSLAVAGLVARGTTTIQGAERAAKSFPEFFTRLQVLTGSSTVKS